MRKLGKSKIYHTRRKNLTRRMEAKLKSFARRLLGKRVKLSLRSVSRL